jgi:hypothetical protein
VHLLKQLLLLPLHRIKLPYSERESTERDVAAEYLLLHQHLVFLCRFELHGP